MFCFIQEHEAVYVMLSASPISANNDVTQYTTIIVTAIHVVDVFLVENQPLGHRRFIKQMED